MGIAPIGISRGTFLNSQILILILISKKRSMCFVEIIARLRLAPQVRHLCRTGFADRTQLRQERHRSLLTELEHYCFGWFYKYSAPTVLRQNVPDSRRVSTQHVER